MFNKLIMEGFITACSEIDEGFMYPYLIIFDHENHFNTKRFDVIESVISFVGGNNEFPITTDKKYRITIEEILNG